MFEFEINESMLNLRSQSSPSPLKPGLHTHCQLPEFSIHFASASHSWEQREAVETKSHFEAD